MASSGGSDEGLIVAIGMIVIFLCIAGSHTTGVSPLQFFFLGATVTGFGLLFFGIVVMFIISVCRVWVEAHKADGRTLWQIVKAEYSPQKISAHYQTVGNHIRRHSRNYWDSPRAARIRRFTETNLARARHGLDQVKLFWRYYKDAGRDDL